MNFVRIALWAILRRKNSPEKLEMRIGKTAGFSLVPPVQKMGEGQVLSNFMRIPII